MITEQFTAGSILLKHRLVSLSTTQPGYVNHTNWGSFDSVGRAIGVVMNDTHEGEPCDVCVFGMIEDPGWTFIPNKPVYAFDQGTFTQSIPPVNIFEVGMAVTSTKLFDKLPFFIMGH